MKVLQKFFVVAAFSMVVQPVFSNEINCKYYEGKSGDKYKKYINNTVWIVPPSTLLAYEFSDGNHIPVVDQTVWVISEYSKGYFFGESYTALDGSPSSQRKIVGSITPDGEVYISFYPISDTSQETDIIEGIGTFEKHKGKYLFVMQMNSPQNSLTGLSHWSYMISVKPDDYYYQHLPSLDISVPEFIAQF